MLFEIGDEVEIVRKIPSKHGGWKNVWSPSMSQFVNNGRVYIITSISEHGSGLSLKDIDSGANSGYLWPTQALELANKVPFAKIIRKINAIDKIRKGLGYAF
jgi:hypothetical protein